MAYDDWTAYVFTPIPSEDYRGGAAVEAEEMPECPACGAELEEDDDGELQCWCCGWPDGRLADVQR